MKNMKLNITKPMKKRIVPTLKAAKNRILPEDS